MPRSGAPGFARTAAGLCVMFLSGEYKADEIPRGVEYLKTNFNTSTHFYYGHYYAAHAMHQVGGKDWEDWYGRLVQYFVHSNSQNTDGSWSTTNRREVGPVYQTSIAVIILSVPAHYLPIFQRLNQCACNCCSRIRENAGRPARKPAFSRTRLQQIHARSYR